MTDLIRQRIVDLVPELKNAEVFTPMPCPDDRTGCLVAHGTFSYPSPSLADVLRAIPDRKYRVDPIGDFWFGNTFTGAHWDLTKSYDDQLPEVKAFIGKRIGVV